MGWVGREETCKVDWLFCMESLRRCSEERSSHWQPPAAGGNPSSFGPGICAVANTGGLQRRLVQLG